MTPGRQVIIKLDAYPYLQYGVIEGIIENVSLAAQDEIYIVDIELPKGLKTSTGEELKFTHNMSGRAEIVTDKLRLIERITEPFRHIINRNRILAQ